MTVIKSRVTVAGDRRIPGVPPGEHEAAITVATAPKRRRSVRDVPVHPEPWDNGVSLRREDIHHDGR